MNLNQMRGCWKIHKEYASDVEPADRCIADDALRRWKRLSHHSTAQYVQSVVAKEQK